MKTFNHHLRRFGKGLLLIHCFDSNSNFGNFRDFKGFYTVVKCGASGHNVRSLPSMAAPRVGMMVLGNKVQIVDHVINAEGTWLKISPELASKFCFNHDGEAWSLALSPNDVLYLRHEPCNEKGERRFVYFLVYDIFGRC